MAKALEIERHYTSIKTYNEYKKLGRDVLKEHENDILGLGEDDLEEEVQS